jgi:UDP-glucose 4-epimerase
MKKALILGGAGFIGNALVHHLKHLGVDVTSVDRYWDVKPAGVNCITGDVFEQDCLNSVMPDQDVVFHLVSTTVPASSNQSPLYDCETNVLGSLRILDAMVDNNVGRIVFSSSGGTVYGVQKVNPINESATNFPISAYGIGKISIEKYLSLYSHLHGIKSTALRLSNPFGPGQVPEKGQGVIATFIKRALKNETIEVWGDGSVIRDFIYIDDVIDALVMSTKTNQLFTLLNIGMGIGKSINEIIEVIEKEVGHKIPINFKPPRVFDVPEVVLDINTAKSTLGWQPKSTFEDGMKKMIAHIEAQLNSV